MTTRGRDGRTPLADLLGRDHERLEKLFEETIDAARAGVDTRTLGEIWTRFRTGLVRHIEAEEKLLFPLFEARRPIDVAEIRQEHGDIRAQLDVLDLEVDLHLVRGPQIEAFVQLLRRHAREEDEGLYAWADDLIDPAHRAAVEKMIATP